MNSQETLGVIEVKQVGPETWLAEMPCSCGSKSCKPFKAAGRSSEEARNVLIADLKRQGVIKAGEFQLQEASSEELIDMLQQENSELRAALELARVFLKLKVKAPAPDSEQLEGLAKANKELHTELNDLKAGKIANLEIALQETEKLLAKNDQLVVEQLADKEVMIEGLKEKLAKAVAQGRLGVKNLGDLEVLENKYANLKIVYLALQRTHQEHLKVLKVWQAAHLLTEITRSF